MNRTSVGSAPFQWKDFMKLVYVVIAWLEGYYTEDDNPTTIDFAEFKSTLEKLLAYCSKNPTVGLLTAADEVMGGSDGNNHN